MSTESGTTPNRRLFCYGSLQVAGVIHAVIGRVPNSRAAALPGHALRRIRDASYPGVVPQHGAETAGRVYEGLSAGDLARLDEFEGEPYSRELRTVHLENGVALDVWVYLLPHNRLDWLTEEPWDLENFRRDDLAEFMRRCSDEDGS